MSHSNPFYEVPHTYNKEMTSEEITVRGSDTLACLLAQVPSRSFVTSECQQGKYTVRGAKEEDKWRFQVYNGRLVYWRAFKHGMVVYTTISIH